MIRPISEKKVLPITLDLTGPEGNAFSLIAVAKNLGDSLGYDEAKINGIVVEMTSGDYDNLIQVLERE